MERQHMTAAHREVQCRLKQLQVRYAARKQSTMKKYFGCWRRVTSVSFQTMRVNNEEAVPTTKHAEIEIENPTPDRSQENGRKRKLQWTCSKMEHKEPEQTNLHHVQSDSQRLRKEVPQPTILKSCNCNMGGIDLCDIPVQENEQSDYLTILQI
ncbi:uncharacterized protein LOC126278213 [Schistocerca gregaria]|uniref:uncharacterized protein LOC126278213 n=1 Tax=Schistocerca gregaria TaxID=7010 RepID=UPI00211EEBAE|nr:uncharacterized protein LOC126278213 [Schistocerca gregaria]